MRKKRFLEPIEPKCNECVDSIVLKDTKEGFNVCSSCGLVIGNRLISDECEWRSFADTSSGQDMNRIGGPAHPLLDEEDIATTQIASTGSIALSRNQIKGTSGKSQQLFSHYSHIESTLEKLRLSATITTVTQSLFKQLFDLGEIRGRSRDCIIIACAYIACKLDGVPRTIRELCASSGLKRRDVGRSYITIQKLQQSGQLKLRRARHDAGERNSHQFVTRFCSELKLPPSLTNEAIASCKRLDALSLTCGKAPASIAAAAILLECAVTGDPAFIKTVKEVSRVSHISASAIKNLLKIVRPHAQHVISEENATRKLMNLADFEFY